MHTFVISTVDFVAYFEEKHKFSYQNPLLMQIFLGKDRKNLKGNT